MKSALLITNEVTKDTQTYNEKEITKAMVKQGYDVNEFSVPFATTAERDLMRNNSYDFAIIVSQMHDFNSPLFALYNANLNMLKELTNLVFVNDLNKHLKTCNKFYLMKGLLNNGIPTANVVIPEFRDLPKDNNGNVLYEHINMDDVDNHVNILGGYPVVYKRIYGSQGNYVHLVDSRESFRKLLDSERAGPPVFILQEYVESAKAVMFCARVVGNEVYTRMGLGSPYATTDFKTIDFFGRQQIPCNTSDEIKQIALNATRTLGLDTARIDMFLTNEGIKICEVNSMGSLLNTSQAHNLNVAELIVDLAIKKSQKKMPETND